MSRGERKAEKQTFHIPLSVASRSTVGYPALNRAKEPQEEKVQEHPN